MLDPLPINEQEEHSLTCDTCGLSYSNMDQADEDEDLGADYDNINITGHCINC